MCTTRIILCIAAISCASLTADTIVLKGGKKHQGRVISEDGKSYLLEINVTDSIKEERRIPKDQVEEIIKESADVKAFKNIATLGTTPDLLPEAAYTKHLVQVRQFISKFPRSTNIKAAKKILAQLEKEHKTIAAGGIKLNGKLIPQPEIEANAYEIDARILLHQIRQLAAAERYPEALRKWETLQKEYQNSATYQAAAPVAQRILRTYQVLLKQLIDTLDARSEKRVSALKSMGENDRARTEAALAEKRKKHTALVDREKTTLLLKWLTVDTFDKQSIDHSLRETTTSLNALSNIKLSEIKQAGPAYRAAWTALTKDDLKDASKKLQDLKSFRIPARYTEPLEKRLKEKEKAALEAAEKAKLEAEAEKAQQEKLAKEAEEKSKKPRGRKRK